MSWMLLLSILPTTRRLAKLRAAHLWRALLVQVALIMVCVQVVRVLGAAYQHFWIEQIEAAGVVIVMGTVAWSVVWWGCAIRLGWSIRSWLLLVLGFIVAFLSMPLGVGAAVELLSLFR